MSHILKKDEEDAKKQKAKDDRDFRQLTIDFKDTFSSAHGRRVYRWLLGQCMVFETTFTGNSKTFYNEGRRSVGLNLLEMNDLSNVEGAEQLIKEEREVDNE